MPHLNRSRLTVLDLAILVAALTPGLAATRYLTDFVAYQDSRAFIANYSGTPSPRSGWSGLGRERPNPSFDPGGRPLDRRFSYWLMHLAYWGGPCLFSATIVLLALGLIELRRGGREALRQPGSIAAILVVLAASYAVVDAEWDYLTSKPPIVVSLAGFNQILIFAWFLLPRVAGALIGAGWLALALGGCWPREPTGREPLRRLLGAAWITSGAAGQLGIWCQEINL